MRKRTVEMDGAVFVISGMTTDQVEEYVSTLDDILGRNGDAITPENTEKLKRVVWRNVATGLNNAHIVEYRGETAVYEDGYQPWTSERVRREMDIPLVAFLRDAIYEMSGVKQARSGESVAASENNSLSSVAAS